MRSDGGATVLQTCSFPRSHIDPNWVVDELMAVGVLIKCQEQLRTNRSCSASTTLGGAMASPQAAHSDLESLHLLSRHSEGTGGWVALWQVMRS